jgi:DNA-binding MarR family transcriptional regulator
MDSENQKFMRSVELLRSFASVQKSMMQFVQKTAAEHGISVPQYTILITMAPHKEMTQKNLGEKTFLPKSTLSQAVDGLVQAGWINRQPVEGNRREMQLSLSESGGTLLKAIHLQEGGVHQIVLEAIESLSEEQYNELLKAHLQIATHLETRAKEQGGDLK